MHEGKLSTMRRSWKPDQKKICKRLQICIRKKYILTSNNMYSKNWNDIAALTAEKIRKYTGVEWQKCYIKPNLHSWV